MRAMPKKTSPKPSVTKSDVIRSMPNASAGDIIKKAKSLGLKLTANHVYAVRAIDKRRGRPARLGGGGSAVASATRASGDRRQSKTAFIRGFARDMPAAQVVEEAKRAGVKISKAYVYRVRALATPASASVISTAGGGARAGRGSERSRGEGTGRKDPRTEQRLTTLALEIGLVRATILLDRVRAQVGKK
jgi:hypothetical protein